MANNTVKLAVEEATKKTTAGDGRIVRIIGPVVDVKFDGAVPPIYNALTVEAETPIGHLSTILEVESQLPGGVVRTVAMSSTDGLQRGLIATDTGEPMKMPVGPKTLGRIWNVMGKPVDGKPMPKVEEFYPIHHAAPVSTSSPPRPRSSRPASKLLTCSSPTSVAARRACSAAPASARPF